MSYFQARLAEVQIPPKKPQKYLFHVPRTKESSKLKGLLDFPFFWILKFPNSRVRTALELPVFVLERRIF